MSKHFSFTVEYLVDRGFQSVSLTSICPCTSVSPWYEVSHFIRTLVNKFSLPCFCFPYGGVYVYRTPLFTLINYFQPWNMILGYTPLITVNTSVKYLDKKKRRERWRDIVGAGAVGWKLNREHVIKNHIYRFQLSFYTT